MALGTRFITVLPAKGWFTDVVACCGTIAAQGLHNYASQPTITCNQHSSCRAAMDESKARRCIFGPACVGLWRGPPEAKVLEEVQRLKVCSRPSVGRTVFLRSAGAFAGWERNERDGAQPGSLLDPGPCRRPSLLLSAPR